MIHKEPENFVHFTSVAMAELNEKYPKLIIDISTCQRLKYMGILTSFLKPFQSGV